MKSNIARMLIFLLVISSNAFSQYNRKLEPNRVKKEYDYISNMINGRLSGARSTIESLKTTLEGIESISKSDKTYLDEKSRSEILSYKSEMEKDLDRMLSPGDPYFYVIMKIFKDMYIWIHLADPPKMMFLNPKAPLWMGTMLSRIATPDESLPVVFVIGDYHESLTLMRPLNCPIALIGVGASISGLGQPAFKVIKNMTIPTIDTAKKGYIVGFNIFNNTAQYGPAINIDNSKIVVALNYIHSNSASIMGGGIYVKNNIGFPFLIGERPMIIANVITNNNAPKGGGIACDNDGGSIYGLNYIYNNTAQDFGGGVYISESSSIVVGNVISANKADLGGGGVAVRKGSKPIVSVNYISKNDSKQNGGGIWVTRGGGLRLPAVIVWNYILDNTAVNDGGGIALDNDGDAIILMNSSISGNKAIRGGGISLYHPNKDLTYLMGNKIHNNDAEFGGGIWAEGFDGNISTFNIIHGNQAKYQGGGLYLLNCDLYIGNNYIDDNTAQTGGGIYASGSGMPRFFDNHSISSNKADVGAGIYLYDIREIDIEGNAITENIATDKGGGLYLKKVTLPRIFGNNQFLDNRARFGGGIFYEDFTEPDIYGNVFQKNMAKNGGGVYINYERGAIYNNTFKANETSGNGAAIYIPASMKPNIYNNTFLGNIAGSTKAPTMLPDEIQNEIPIALGGAIYSSGEGADPEIKYNLFKWNHAYSGGAIAITDSSQPVLESNDFLENAAGEFYDTGGGIGGALLIVNTDIDVDSSLFVANYATNGGACAIISKSNVDFKNTDFRWNVADIDSAGIGKGGSIFASDSGTTVCIGNTNSSCTFTENFSAFGGALAGESKAEFNLQKNQFIANRAAYNTNGSGGALHFEGKGTKAYIGGTGGWENRNEFFRNTTGTMYKPVRGNGGVMSATKSAYIEMQGNLIKDNNSANNYGGAVFLEGNGTKALLGGMNDDEIKNFPLDGPQYGNVIQNNNRKYNVYPRFWYGTENIPLDTLDSAECEMEEPYELMDTTTTIITEEYDSSPTISVQVTKYYFPRSFVGAVNFTAGVQLYEITNPLLPQLKSVILSNDRTYNIAFKDSLLFLADGNGGVRMFTTSPILLNQSPRFLDDITFTDVSILDVAVINNYVYALGNNDKIYIVQISGNNLVYASTFTPGGSDTLEVASIESYNNTLFADIRNIITNKTDFTAFFPSGNNLVKLDSYEFNGIITDYDFVSNNAYIIYTRQTDDTTFYSYLQGLTIANLWDIQPIATPDMTQAREFISVDVEDNICKIGHNVGFISVNLSSGTSTDRVWSVPGLDIESYDGVDYLAHGYGGMASYNSETGQAIFESERPQEKEQFQFQWIQSMGWRPDTSWYWEPPEAPDTVICNGNIVVPNDFKKKSYDELQIRINPTTLPRNRYVYDIEDIIITKRGGFLAITNNADAEVYGNMIGGAYEFDGNQATEYGGAIYVENGGDSVILGGNYGDEKGSYTNYFLGNQSALGGAISLSNSLNWPVIVENNIIGGSTDLQSNLAHCTGGAIHSDTSNIIVRYNIIQNNTAGVDSIPNYSAGGFGAGIALFESGADINHNWIIGNYSLGNGAGIGIAKNSGRIIVSNNTFSENIAIKSRIPYVEDTLGLGTDIFIGTLRDSLIIEGNIFDHFGLFEAYSIYADSSRLNDSIFYLDARKISIKNNDVYNNTGMRYGGQLFDLTGIDGNISVNPLFTDPKIFNYNTDPASSAAGKGWNPNPRETKISSSTFFVPGTHSTITDALNDADYGDKIIVAPCYESKYETFPIKIKDGVILTSTDFNIPYDAIARNCTWIYPPNNGNDTVIEMNNTGSRTVLAGFKIDNNDVPVVFNNARGLVYGNIIKGKNKSAEITFVEDTIKGNDHFIDRLIIDHNTFLNKVTINYDTLTDEKPLYQWLKLHKLQFGPLFAYNIAKIEANIKSLSPVGIHSYLDEPPIFITFEMNDFWNEDLKGYYEEIKDASGNNLKLKDPMFAGDGNYHLLLGSQCILTDSAIVWEKDDTLHKYYDYTGMIGALYADIEPNFRADTISCPPGLEILFKDSSKAELRHEVKKYRWMWGDGDSTTYMSKTYNIPAYIKHKYDEAGTFSVSLSIRDRYTTFTKLKSDYINADTSWKKDDETFATELNRVFFTDSLRGWIVGDEGLILKTDNGGDTWIEVATGEIVFRKDKKDNLTSGWNKIELNTGEYKKIRSIKLLAITDNLYDVCFINKDTGWVAGENGIMMFTSDGGLNWKTQNSNIANTLTRVNFINGSRGYAAGIDGTIISTYDGGQTWIKQDLPAAENLYALLLNHANEGWAAGNNGIILYDGGTGDWEIQNSFTDERLNDIEFGALNNGWVVGNNGMLLNTSDFGTNWLARDIAIHHNLNDIDFVDSLQGWVVGDYGTILFTIDGGKNWRHQYSGTKTNLKSVTFTDKEHGWAIGSNGEIYYTLNGGITTFAEDNNQHNNLNVYPNPFHDGLEISFFVPNSGLIEMSIYNSLGRKIRNLFIGIKDAGQYKLNWDMRDNSGNKVSSGMYIIEYLNKFSERTIRQSRNAVLVE